MTDRGEFRTALFMHGNNRCAVCGEGIDLFACDIHEYLVKRNAVSPKRQHLIFVPQNCVLLHRECHQNSRETDRKCLDHVLTRTSAAEIAKWYWSLTKQIWGLPRGNTVLYQSKDWESYLRSLI